MIIQCNFNNPIQSIQLTNCQNMLETKSLDYLPQQEHLQQPPEEISALCESQTSTQSSQNGNNLHFILHNKIKLRIAVVSAFLLIVFIIVGSWMSWNRASRRSPLKYHDVFSTMDSRLVRSRFPKILWIYTQNQRDAQHMQQDIYYNYFAHFAQKTNYKVRYVNGLTAYDFLSNQTVKNITEVMNKRTVDQTVHSFLKLALLLENGGLLIEPGTMLLGNDFKWIQYMFDKYQVDLQIYDCKPEESSLYVAKNGDKYDTMIMAAVPQNPFIRQLLNFMSQVVTSDELKKQASLSSRLNISGLTWNNTLRVYGFSNSISDCINHLVKLSKKQKCYSGIQSATINLTLALEPNEQPTPYSVANKVLGFEELLYSRGVTNGNEVKAITGFNTYKIKEAISLLALGRHNTAPIQNTLMHQLLQVPGNKQILLEDLPQSQIQLCLVIMEPLNNQQLMHTSTLFKEQTYTNWKLIMPAKDIKNAPLFEDFRIKVMQSKSTQVHNIEKAVAKHCPHKSYAVVLNYNQTFQNRSALDSIAKAAQPRQVVGIYIPLQSDGELYQVKQNYTKFYRFQDGIVDPKLELLKSIVNHFRVFSVQTFKTIPQFAMRDWNGKYFKDRLIFLMDFLDLIHRVVNQPEQLYLMKKNANIWSIPTKVSVLDNVALLRINQFEQIDREQLKVTRTRVSTRSLKLMFHDLIRYKIPISKMAAFNPGEDFVPVQERKGPELIPRVIHQVWLGSEIPSAKKYFIQKTKKVYTGYEIKVWREHNITRELFPTTYDIIQTLLDFNKRSPYNKLATVTDIMRHQILYREGGLWKDAGMNMLRRIPDSFLKYKLVLSTDRLYQYRYLQGMCFFGNMPKYQNMLRINNYRNLNRMRIHSNDPIPIAGPVDFRQLLIGQEEFDPNILLIPYQTFYPGQVGQHPDGDLCTTRQLKDNQKYEIVQGGWYLLPGCEQKYPYAFAIQHNNYGSSWVGPQQLQKL